MSMYLITFLKDEKEIVTKAIVDKNEIEGMGKVPYLESVKRILEAKGIIRNGRFRQGEYVLKPYFFLEGSQPMLTLKAAIHIVSQLKKSMDKRNGIDNEYRRVDYFDLETCYTKYGKEVTKEYLSKYDEEDIIVIQILSEEKEREEMLDLLNECSAGIVFVVGNGGKNKEETDFFSATGFEVHSIMYTDKEYFWNVFKSLLKHFEIKIKKEVFVEVFRQMMQKVGPFVCEEVFFSLVSKAKEREKKMMEEGYGEKKLFDDSLN